MKKVKVGIVGCGNISGIYLKNLTELFHITEVVAVADLDEQRAKTAAETYQIPKVCTTEELLANPEIEIVLNLTTPPFHFEICKAALEAGKSTYTEKPLSLTREQGKELVALAKEKRLLLGGAPDTFMGAGIQTSRKLIDDGWIGKVIGATAFMTCHGHESWHPDPEFYYKTGGGPMFDMGPYYLTALVSLIGTIDSVYAETKANFPTRTITSEKKYGTKIEVDVPTHYVGTMNFVNGAIGTIITSFDIWASQLPRIEIYGTEGSISVPDPNTFGGQVLVKCAHHDKWNEIPYTHRYWENSRGIGVADMALALQDGGKNRACGELAYHVLDVMHTFEDASQSGRRTKIESTCGIPAPVDPSHIY